MEIIIIVITILAAILGGWAGYFFAHRSNKKEKALELAFSIYSGLESKQRANAINRLERLPQEALVLVTDKASSEFEDLRQDLVALFNRYDLVCYAFNHGHLDREVFCNYIYPLIKSDRQKTDLFFSRNGKLF